MDPIKEQKFIRISERKVEYHHLATKWSMRYPAQPPNTQVILNAYAQFSFLRRDLSVAYLFRMVRQYFTICAQLILFFL